ncbi:MAG TPA: hypothetical protein VHY35_05320 [Stellaceae bacterium]|jgi:hypothetical protein|nr:hypothetical protein [Stellaceae bacterium]
MVHEFRPGGIVPDSGVYRIRHDPEHPEMAGQLTLIKGQLFPTCRGCGGMRFTLSLAAENPAEVERFAEDAAEQR